MADLLWWSGITMQTPVNEIGWTYVVLAVLLLALVLLTTHLVRLFRGDHR